MSKVFFKLGTSDKIFEADSYRHFNSGFMRPDELNGDIYVVEFNASRFKKDGIPPELERHQYFTMMEAKHAYSIYLVKEGDKVYRNFKDTRLARKMYPNAIQHKGWLLIESE